MVLIMGHMELSAFGTRFAGASGIVELMDDLGSALVWAPVIGAMLLVGSIPFRYLIVIVLSGTLVLPFAYFFNLKDYQKKRITVQIDMLIQINFLLIVQS